MTWLRPFIQVERGRVEQVGSALRLYRFRTFDLTICWSLKYPRIALTIAEWQPVEIKIEAALRNEMGDE